MSQALYNIKYDESKEIIVEISPEGKENVLSDEFPSPPVYSPNKMFASYIAPLEWEEMGSLYVYDLLKGINHTCIKPDNEGNIPKHIQWLDDNTLLVIIGFAHGTISIGGNLFKYDLATSTLTQITNHSGEIQLTEIKLHDDFIVLSGIRYIDDILNEFESFEEEIKKSEI